MSGGEWGRWGKMSHPYKTTGKITVCYINLYSGVCTLIHFHFRIRFQVFCPVRYQKPKDVYCKSSVLRTDQNVFEHANWMCISARDHRTVHKMWPLIVFFFGSNVCGSVSKYFLCQWRQWFQICVCVCVCFVGIQCQRLRLCNASSKWL